jgi:RNA recognition motif-containing protein
MNIFVAKLSQSTNSDSLLELFSGYGQVDSAKVIMDKETGRSKGFGFVEMPEESEGLNAIESLNEVDFEGSNIVVKKARPRESSGGGNQYNKRRSFNRH